MIQIVVTIKLGNNLLGEWFLKTVITETYSSGKWEVRLGVIIKVENIT